MKRILSVLLVVLLIASVFGACKAKEKIVTVTSIVEKEVEVIKEVEKEVEVIKEVDKIVEVEKVMEHKTITWMMRDNSIDYSMDLKVFDWLGEAGNLTIERVATPIDVYMERLSVMVAGGELTDIVNVGPRDIFIPSMSPDFDLAQEIGPKGMLVSLSDNLDKLPHYKGWLDKFESYVGGITAADGNIYLASTIRNYNPTSSLGGVIRSDLSGTTSFETFDDLYNVLAEMRSNMDGPIWTNRNGILDLNLLSYSFGTSLCDFPYYDQYKSEFVNTIETANFKDAILFFKSLVEADILTPEWAAYPEPQWYTDAGDGTCQFWVDNMMNAPTHNRFLAENGLSGSFGAFVPPSYNGTFYGWAGKSRFSTTGSVISADTEALDNILAMLDWTYDFTNHDKLYWGEEGITYIQNAAGNPMNPRPGVTKEESFVKLIKDVYGTGENSNWVKVYANAEYFDDRGNDSTRLWQPYGKIYGDNVYTYSVPPVPLNESEAETLKEIKAPLTTYVQENITNFINGNTSMDEFDAFVAKVKDLGADTLVEMYNVAVAR